MMHTRMIQIGALLLPTLCAGAHTANAGILSKAVEMVETVGADTVKQGADYVLCGRLEKRVENCEAAKDRAPAMATQVQEMREAYERNRQLRGYWESATKSVFGDPEKKALTDLERTFQAYVGQYSKKPSAAVSFACKAKVEAVHNCNRELEFRIQAAITARKLGQKPE